MAIAKEITLDTTGGVASYHYVASVGIDRVNKIVSASIQSYVSADTFKAGKQPVSFAQSVSLQGVPAEGQDAFAFAEAELVKPEPTPDATALPVLQPYMMMNRYLLAGGEVVA